MSHSLRVRCSGLRPSEFRVVGDKSISHRAFLLNALGEGEARIRGANSGADVASTVNAMRALGVSIVERDGEFLVRGRGGRLRPAADAIDCGNSGTTMRLLAGILAAQPFTTTLDGDASLRARPMSRIATPLRAMGARMEGPSNAERAPLVITGGALKDFVYESPVASAQIKSALLLASACAGVRLRLCEPAPSRDHSERMLRAMGASIREEGGWLESTPATALHCLDLDVPGDPSAAALLALPFLLCGTALRVPGLLHNPTRSGFFDLLGEMGATLSWHDRVEQAGETRATLELTAGDSLRGLELEAARVPSLIDEIPLLIATGLLLPAGESLRVHGIAELRVKESDRVAATVDLLAQAKVVVQVAGDSLVIAGGQVADAAILRPADDHRMAMLAVGLATAIAQQRAREVVVHGIDSIAVSDPHFLAHLRAAGAELED